MLTVSIEFAPRVPTLRSSPAIRDATEAHAGHLGSRRRRSPLATGRPGQVRGSRRRRLSSPISRVRGLGLSILAMIAAAFGYLAPVQGALLQEVIDVAVILNALRALQ